MDGHLAVQLAIHVLCLVALTYIQDGNQLQTYFNLDHIGQNMYMYIKKSFLKQWAHSEQIKVFKAKIAHHITFRLTVDYKCDKYIVFLSPFFSVI